MGFSRGWDTRRSANRRRPAGSVCSPPTGPSIPPPPSICADQKPARHRLTAHTGDVFLNVGAQLTAILYRTLRHGSRCWGLHDELENRQRPPATICATVRDGVDGRFV